MGKFIDLTGQRFGRLEVISPAFSDRHNTWHWDCMCDCGNKKIAGGGALRSGRTQSCGCLQLERIKEASYIHGRSHTRIEGIRNDMVQRCHNINNSSYSFYGGRGITVCDEWRKNPISFYEWADTSGYKPDLTIDRINNEGNYEPTNCKWISRKLQARNRRSNYNITFNGETRTLQEWEEVTGINANTIKCRLKRKWSIERALTQAPLKIKDRERGADGKWKVERVVQA